MVVPVFGTWYNEDLFYAVYFVVFLVDFVVAYRNVFVRGRVGVLRREFSTYFVFVGLVFLTIFLSFYFGYLSYFTGVGELPVVFMYVGLTLMVAGEGFRAWAILTLGRYFSPIVTVYTDQRVVTQGPYRLVRHPAYGGAIIVLLGIALSLRSLFSLVLIPIGIAFFNHRANLEERLLIQTLGEEYLNYRKRVRRKFIPYVL